MIFVGMVGSSRKQHPLALAKILELFEASYHPYKLIHKALWDPKVRFTDVYLHIKLLYIHQIRNMESSRSTTFTPAALILFRAMVQEPLNELTFH